ncbi:MAG: hypothetical protein K0U84_18510 [Actinomycetia bacterium]|nr:hypothetical protein [Actinomycetes bacterium]
MTLRQSLRSLGYLIAEFIPWQAVDVVRGRDYDAAVLAAADALADEEAEYETFEPPVVVEPHSPAAPTAGLSDWQQEQLRQHARRWCDLPTLQPGPLPTPEDHPDNT